MIANKQSEYKRLGDIVSKARRAGLIDWDSDHRPHAQLRSLGSWDSPASIVEASAEQFRYDRWETQPSYVEVWFEKDALMGVFERVANELRVPFFSCRGYTRLRNVGRSAAPSPKAKGFRDPALWRSRPEGIDMTRDIRDRLALFGASQRRGATPRAQHAPGRAVRPAAQPREGDR
jgi:hypothetical protein